MNKNKQKNSPNNTPLFEADYAEKGELKCLIDWCQFTLPYSMKMDDVFLLLGIPSSEFTEVFNSSLLGYTQHFSCAHIKVMTKGASDPLSMGHHVLMSGQACREFELYNGNRWYDFLQSILDIGGHFTRFDVAFDDFHGYFKIPALVKKIKKGELTSKFKKAKRIEDMLIKDGSTKGTTLYFGRSTSDIQIYMYEKNFEQKIEDEISIWNRTEVRMRDIRADLFVMNFLSVKNLANVASGVIANYLTFRDKGEDTNKSRWKVSRFWTRFLNNAEKIQLTTKKPDRSIERLENWMRHQVRRAASIMSIVKPEFLNELAVSGFDDLDSKDEQLIQSHMLQEKELNDALFEKRVDISTNMILPRSSDSETLVSVFNERDDLNKAFVRRGVRSEFELQSTLEKMKNHSDLNVKTLVPVGFFDENVQKKDTVKTGEFNSIS